jgi:hypothetical protein
MTDYGEDADKNTVDRWSFAGLMRTNCFRPTVLTSMTIGAALGIAKGYTSSEMCYICMFFFCVVISKND